MIQPGQTSAMLQAPPGPHRQGAGLSHEDESAPDLTEFLSEADQPSYDPERVSRSLHAHVLRAWQQARIAKEPIERELLRCLRQRNGQYEEQTLQVIRESGGSEIYMKLTQIKCRAVESWVRDILFQPGQRPYEVRATPVPEIPDDVQEMLRARVEGEVAELMAGGLMPTQDAVDKRLGDVEARLLQLAQEHAKERAERMQERINDEFDQGHWQHEFEDYITDFVTYPTAFFGGPFRSREKTLGWSVDQYGRTMPVVENKTVRRYERISPWDAFPAPNARTLDDGPMIIRRRYRPDDLYALIGLPTYSERAIRDALNAYGETGYELATSHDDARQRAEGRDHEDWATDKPIEAIDYWGKVSGRTLLDWGFDPAQIPDAFDSYECNVVVVGNYVIRGALNPHPLGRRPFTAESLERVPGMVWGQGLPQIIRDLQDQANTCARALANNVTLASGFMGDINIDRLAEGEDPYDIGPFRLFQTKSPTVATSQRAVNFFQPTMNADALVKVYQFFSSLADEYSGIPPYAQGVNTSGGAASTATGLSILMEQAARGIKYAVWILDRAIVSTVKATWEDLMLFDQDESIKGDAAVVARASSALIHRDRQAARQIEFLQMTGNPVDQQILGVMGRRTQLEEAFRLFDIDPDGIVPTEDDLRAMLMQQAQAQSEMMAQQAGQNPGKPQEMTVDGRRAGGPQPAEAGAGAAV